MRTRVSNARCRTGVAASGCGSRRTNLALAAHRALGGQDNRIEHTRLAVADVRDGARAADASEEELDAFMARGSQDPQIVDDAGAHGWTQLVAAEHIDLRPPHFQALAYVTTCALRHAWLLNRKQQRAGPTEHSPPQPVL